MALSKYKLGELIQLENGQNTNDSYNIKVAERKQQRKICQNSIVQNIFFEDGKKDADGF